MGGSRHQTAEMGGNQQRWEGGMELTDTDTCGAPLCSGDGLGQDRNSGPPPQPGLLRAGAREGSPADPSRDPVCLG